jgi:phosphoribosylanthranilate isomerase
MAVTVKICGVRDLETADFALAAGADWVGLVLAPTRRRVDWDTAEAIVQSHPGRIIAVVRDVPDALFQRLWTLPWGGLQVYDRPFADWVPPARARGWLTVRPGRREADRDGAEVLLLEPPEPGQGRRLDWRELAVPARPFWLAGGLSPDNVREALAWLEPDGVDVSSGVERNGEKDRGLIRRFIEEVKSWRG